MLEKCSLKPSLSCVENTYPAVLLTLRNKKVKSGMFMDSYVPFRNLSFVVGFLWAFYTFTKSMYGCKSRCSNTDFRILLLLDYGVGFFFLLVYTSMCGSIFFSTCVNWFIGRRVLICILSCHFIYMGSTPNTYLPFD